MTPEILEGQKPEVTDAAIRLGTPRNVLLELRERSALAGIELDIDARRISKQGDRYLRSLLVHGGRSVLLRARAMEKPDRLRAWALTVYSRRGHNKATVAVANKLARTAWAVWKHNTEFKSYPAKAA